MAEDRIGATTTIVGWASSDGRNPAYDKDGSKGVKEVSIPLNEGYTKDGEFVQTGTTWYTVSAAGEYADRLPAPRQDLGKRSLRRRRPGQPLAPEIAGQREVPLAADHQAGLRQQVSCGRREAFEAVFAKADDRQPRLQGRTHRRLRVEG